MSRQAKISLAIVGVFALVLTSMLALTGMSEDPEPEPVSSGESRLVRDDSRILGERADTGVTFVEFLDFECEGCRAAYPAIEQLRKDYAGRVTFVARYFPLGGHFNGERAARAVEAAAQQGKFEEMYSKMFETQAKWGEQRKPLDDLFASYAEDLGLDMKQFKADYADPATAKRIQKDVADGEALGVQGTPTFFVDGKQLQPQTYGDLTDALDAALAQQ